METSTTTAGLMPPPAATLPLRQDICNQEYAQERQYVDRPPATGNLLKKRHRQIERIDIERSAKRPRSDSQGPLRPPTPFPRGFVSYPLLLTNGDECGVSTTATTITTSNSPMSLSADSVIPRGQCSQPPQLSEIVDALTCLRDNIMLLTTKLEGPTARELMDLVTEPCESIARNLRAVATTHAACIRHAEQNAREQLRAEMMAFLHMPDW